VEPVTAEPPPVDSELLPTCVEPVTAEPPPVDSLELPTWVEPVTADPPPSDPGLLPICTQGVLVALPLAFESFVSLLLPLLVFELPPFEDATAELVFALAPLEDATDPPELVFALVVALAPPLLLEPLVVVLLLDV